MQINDVNQNDQYFLAEREKNRIQKKAEKLNNKWFKVLVGKSETGSGGTIKKITIEGVGNRVRLFRYFPADFSNYWLSISDISNLSKKDF